LLGLALPWLWGATAVDAQSSRRRASGGGESGGSAPSDIMKMPSTAITGERQTPDIFFVFPTGKGGDLSMPHLRDYGPDILEPVVKPWFEREQALGPSQIQAVTRQLSVDWKEALKRAPPPPPREAAPEASSRPSLPAPSIPSSALSRPPPPPPDSPIYQRPPPAYGAAPTPPPVLAAPPPAQPPTYRGVPVLPPQ
jgi:hypothetical protein